MFAIEHNRRRFLSLLASAVGPVAFGEPRSALRFLVAEKVLRIGVFAPRGADAQKPFSGHALMRGFELGLDEARRTAEMFGFTLHVDTLGEADLQTLPGKISSSNPPYSVLLGGSEAEYCLRIAAAAASVGALYVNAGCAVDSLRADQCGRHVFHVASSNAMRLDATLSSLAAKPDSAVKRWVLIAEKKACDSLQPRIARYAERSGASIECVSVRLAPVDDGLSTQAIVIDLVSAGADAPPPIAHPGTVLSASDWHGSLERFGAGQLSDRFRARYGGAEVHSLSYSGWLAAKIAVEALMRSRATSAEALITHLEKDSTHFDGHKGVPLSFRRWDHQLRQPVYVLRSSGENRSAVAVEEQPSRRSSDDDAVTTLDQLGFTSEETACRWHT